MDIYKVIAKYWGWSGVEPEEIVAENDFGNLIIRDGDGKFWRLSPEDAYCEIIAEDKAEMDALLEDEEFVDDWYLEALADEAEKKIGPLKEGVKYCFVIPPVVGGEYEVSNMNRMDLDELLEITGAIGEKIENLPDGAEVTLEDIE